jgi:hypothetical protein
MIAHFNHDIPGFCDFQDLYQRAVKQLVTKERPTTFVELGVYRGRSTAFLAVELHNRCMVDGARARLMCFDTFDWAERAITAETKTQLEELLDTNGLINTFLFTQDSTEAAKRFEDGSVDFCFIDACHDEAKVRADINAWLPKIRKGGVLAGHDYEGDYPNTNFMGGYPARKALWPGVKKAVDSIFGKNKRIMRTSWWVDV